MTGVQTCALPIYVSFSSPSGIEWKTKMSLEIAKYTNYQNADIVNMIIEGAYDDIFEKVYTL